MRRQRAGRWSRAAAVAVAALAAVLTVTGSAFSATPSHRPAFVDLTDGGDAFLNYDGTSDRSLSRTLRDWPVTLMFHNSGSVYKAKAALADIGWTRQGSEQYMPYKPSQRGRVRFDGDRGRKTHCISSDSGDPDRAHYNHARVYGQPHEGKDSKNDRFYDRRFGYFAVATTHQDYGEFGCGRRTFFGYSERVEKLIADELESRFTINRNYLGLGNREGNCDRDLDPCQARRDVNDGSRHRWQSNGFATLILMP